MGCFGENCLRNYFIFFLVEISNTRSIVAL